MAEVKNYLSYQQQVDKLSNYHGLIIEDNDFALQKLKDVNYYYLRGYYIHWMDDTQEKFIEGITIERIWGLFQSDCRMRMLLMSCLEKVELKTRNIISNVLAERYGPLGYEDSKNFSNREHHEIFLAELSKEINRSREAFIKHHLHKYDGKFPIWVAIEILSFGTVSKLYKNMVTADKKLVADALYIKSEQVTSSYFHCLSNLRNTCAHFARIYNRNFPIGCFVQYRDRDLIAEISPGSIIDPHSLFSLVLAVYHLVNKDIQERLVHGIDEIITSNQDYELLHIGFPECWHELMV